MNNTTEPRLPEIYLTGVKIGFDWANLGWFLLAIFPLVLLVGIPLLGLLYFIVKYLFYMALDLCYNLCDWLYKCQKNCNCATEVEWKEKAHQCQSCAGRCDCSHVGRMETDI